MALPVTKAGYEIMLELQRVGSPATYDFVCGINSTELNLETELIEANVRDCATPATPPVRVTKPGPKSASVSGSGQYANEFEDELWAVYNGGVTRNWRIKIVGGPMYTAAFVMTSLQIAGNAEDQSLATVTIALTASGDVTRAATWS